MKQQKVLNKKLGELNNIRNEFLHTTANEMQTPVSKLNNMVEQLRHDPTGQNADKIMDIISAISKKMYYSVNDILDMTMLNNDALVFNIGVFDLAEVLKEAIYLNSYFVSDNFRFTFDGTEHIYVKGDRERLSQVFHELMSFVIRNYEKGTMTFKTLIDDDVRILVYFDSDQSGELSSENLENISKLDLTLTHLEIILKKMNGDFHILSLNNGNMMLRIAVPIGSKGLKLAGRKQMVVSGTTNIEAPSDIRSVINKPNIVIIDRASEANFQVFNGLQKVFETKFIYTEHDLKSVLFSKHKPELFLINAKNASTSSIKLVKSIRELYNPLEMPILMMGDSMREFFIKEAYSAGVSDFIKNMNALDVFERKIKLHLDMREAADALVKTRMYYLQAQIQPHFIYNALNSVLALMGEDIQRAEDLLLDFSDYLKQSIYLWSNTETIPIASEIEYVKIYASIEKARFGDKINIEYDIEEGINCNIPSLSIQPLVENAVKHNVGKKPGILNVKLSLYCEGEHVHVEVSDNGVGFIKDKESNTNGVSTQGAGIGLENIKKRINHYLNEELSIETNKYGGTMVGFKFNKEDHCESNYSR